MYDVTGNPIKFDEGLQGADQENKEHLIEVVYYTTDEHITLFANNYPVYV